MLIYFLPDDSRFGYLLSFIAVNKKIVADHPFPIPIFTRTIAYGMGGYMASVYEIVGDINLNLHLKNVVRPDSDTITDIEVFYSVETKRSGHNLVMHSLIHKFYSFSRSFTYRCNGIA